MPAPFLDQIQISSQLRDFLIAMREMGTERTIPNISWNTAQFLFDTLHDRNISTVLEIGPANGFSTMMLTLACPGAEITSIEISRHAFEELRKNVDTFFQIQSSKFKVQNEGEKYLNGISSKENFLPAELGPKVTSDINQVKIGNFSLYYADARDILPAFKDGCPRIECGNPKSVITDIPARKFDMIFIDGAFRMTQEFYDLSVPLLSKGGIIILDDAIKYRWKMEGFHEYLTEKGIPFELVQTDEDDGVMVIDNQINPIIR